MLCNQHPQTFPSGPRSSTDPLKHFKQHVVVVKSMLTLHPSGHPCKSPARPQGTMCPCLHIHAGTSRRNDLCPENSSHSSVAVSTSCRKNEACVSFTIAKKLGWRVFCRECETFRSRAHGRPHRYPRRRRRRDDRSSRETGGRRASTRRNDAKTHLLWRGEAPTR